MPDTQSDYPFHTGEINGTECAGVLFVAGNGRFYEFQDPETHDDYARFECPRTGATMVYNNELDRSVKRVMGGHVTAHVPADEWVEFREQYVGAEEEQTAVWERAWQDLHVEQRQQMVTAE